MELFGVPLETVYLYGLIIFGGVTFLFILFNDIFSGLELPDIFNPTLIFCFLTVFFASGFLLESLSGLNAGLCAGISLIISFTIVTLLNVFVLIPISSAEESLTFHDNDLRGRVGRVLTSIPVDGFGEVLIESISGSIAKTAASYKNEGIVSDTKVLIIEVKNGVIYVMPHQD
ncbi:NfeD family protein [Peribacillus frigoritolerans]|uniref:NfeD family protein n=1 Tax=Peribacillus frigoritolerans TaxID=450367 RepID=UPI0022802CD6|nr:NfeD family protein [Peribacillus frigoritolerans]MCY8939801.1 NfeD family protein [Peribacillus frigoritolerans]